MSSLSNISRLGPDKVEFLVRGVAQVRPGSDVLELFGGSGLSTACIAKQLSRPDRLTTVDRDYQNLDFERWASKFKLRPERPRFVLADARDLPFPDRHFDYVLAPDSPRTRFEGTGEEWGLSPVEQKSLFLESAQEALRVLREGGIFAATAPRSWCEALEAKIISSSRRLAFRECDDPVVYMKLTHE